MKAYRNFCIAHHRALLMVSLVFALSTVCMVMTGCNVPAWISAADALIVVMGSSITSVAAFLASLSGNAALAAALNEVSTIITDIGNGWNDLVADIQAYKVNPNDTLLQKIQGGADAIVANLEKLLTDSGLPVAIAVKIQAWAELVASQLDKWLAILPAIHTAAMAGILHQMAKPAVDKLMSPEEFKAAANAIWDAPSEDPAVTAAAAKVPRL